MIVFPKTTVFIKFVVSLTFVNNNPSLTIVYDDPSLTIANIIFNNFFFKNNHASLAKSATGVVVYIVLSQISALLDLDIYSKYIIIKYIIIKYISGWTIQTRK